MTDRPNILLLLVDQWPALAFAHRGMAVRTPNTDRLAGQGTVFTNAFTSCTLCSPARGALLTGRWPSQTGFCDNYGTGYSTQAPLSSDERTWIDAAVAAGYRTGYFGKWHCGTDGPILRGAHAHDESCDRRVPYDPAKGGHSYEQVARRYTRAAAAMGSTAGSEPQLLAGRPPFWGRLRASKEEHRAFRLAERGVSFLEEHVRSGPDRPFFLTVSWPDPHFPHYLPAEYAELAEQSMPDLPPNLEDTFAGKPAFHRTAWWPSMDTAALSPDDWRRVIAYSRAHYSMADEAVGRVLAGLDRLGLSENTRVVFAADHGDMCGAHNRFDKGPYFYDEVWRIPLIVRCPGRPPAEQAAFVSIVDVGATFFDLIGSPAPAPGKPRAGRALTDLLGTAEHGACWPEETFAMYDLYNGMSFAVRGIRTGCWKYLWNPQSVDELYDLETDPAELTNLAGRPEVADAEKMLRARLFAWMDEVGDDLPARADALPAAGTILATGQMGP